MSNQKPENKELDILSLISFRFMPYWPLFLILIVLGLAGAWGYLQYTNPIYKASATILVKDEKKGADVSGEEEALNILSFKKIVENEIEIIQSNNLLIKVVNELGLYAEVYEKGSFKTVSAYNTSPIAILAKNPAKYLAFLLKTKPDRFISSLQEINVYISSFFFACFLLFSL